MLLIWIVECELAKLKQPLSYQSSLIDLSVERSPIDLSFDSSPIDSSFESIMGMWHALLVLGNSSAICQR